MTKCRSPFCENEATEPASWTPEGSWQSLVGMVVSDSPVAWCSECKEGLAKVAATLGRRSTARTVKAPPRERQRFPVAERAAALARFVRAAEKPVSRPEAARAVGCGLSSLGSYVTYARAQRWLAPADRRTSGYEAGEIEPPESGRVGQLADSPTATVSP